MKRIILLKSFALAVSLLCYINAMAQEAYMVLTCEDSTLTYYYDTQQSSRSGKIFDVNQYHSNLITRVVFDPSFASFSPISTKSWFMAMHNLQSIVGLENLNTSQVTDMREMFADCKKLKSLDLRSFDTSQVTKMTHMFNGCSSLTSLDLSSFNTAKVTNMEGMFNGCSSLKSLDLSSFNTSQVTKMFLMFKDCSGLISVDLSNFNTGNVTNMSLMFNGCSSLTSLDLSSFNTSQLAKMSEMFRNCSNLEKIYAGSGWDLTTIDQNFMNNIFLNCGKLVGGKGTSYNEGHVDGSYAHIDGGPSNPGYFTSK